VCWLTIHRKVPVLCAWVEKARHSAGFGGPVPHKTLQNCRFCVLWVRKHRNLQGFGDLGLTKHREKDTVIYRVIFQPPSPSFSPTTQPSGLKLLGPAPPLQASEQFGSQLLRRDHTAHKLTQDPPTHYASCLNTPCFHTYPCCLQPIPDHLSATHSKLFTNHTA
jgi:hypothetical protein